MTITAQTLTRHELLGLSVRVADATNPDLIGIAGQVVAESTNTISIRAGDDLLGDVNTRERRVPKRGTTFAFDLCDETVTVVGERLLARPARRTETPGVSPWV